MEIKIPYGRSSLTANLPDCYAVDIIEAPKPPPALDPIATVQAALENLLGDIRWEDFQAAHSVAIAINDKTRPVPLDQLLPPLLERLAELDIPKSAITFFIAVGTHTPASEEELTLILPRNILSHYRVISHDATNRELMVDLGFTSHGTPVYSNKDYVRSDLKIVIGNIEPHQFAGFSGGSKCAAIGLSAFQTINHNHALMTHPDSQLGAYETNPLRQDIEEIGQKINIHLALNAVLNHNRQIVHVLAGNPLEVMRAGVELSRKVCQVAVPQKYGLMITSPGGHPKDINLYQGQKALGHAALVTRTGGTIILAAACPEGTGSLHYEQWMQDKHSYTEILEAFKQQGFRIGPHKAFQIARDASVHRLLFCSEMDVTQARALLLNPVRDLQTALDIVLPELEPGERIGIMPHAASTIPYETRMHVHT